MPTLTASHGARAAAVAAALLVAVPATSAAKRITFGSDLKAPANVTEARQADTAYWQTRFGDGRSAKAPANGQIRQIRIKGIALSNPKAGVPGGETMFHLQALRKRAGGTYKILRTSQALFLPPKGTDPQKITTYRPTNFCIAKGDVLVFNTVGGWDGIAAQTGLYPKGTPLQIFSNVAGASTLEFMGANQTNNGAIIKGSAAAGRSRELLMQATVGTGKDGTGLCKGGAGG